MLSREALTERLQVAAEAVENANLADDLRTVAFERALTAVGLGAGGAGTASDGSPGSPAGDEANGTHDEDLLGSMARTFGLDRDSVGQIFDEEDGQVRLIIKQAMLPEPTRKAAAMRDVALLVVAGRQAAGLEDYTPVSVIREECRDLKVLDSGNFATELGKLDFRIRGGRNAKEAKANRHHNDEASALIRRIVERSGES